MNEFDDLIDAKDRAVEEDNVAQQALADATAALDKARQDAEASTGILLEAHKAIHDVLAEKGEHYGIDQANGTVTVYKPIDEPPGWCAVHPIPGRTKAAAHESTKKHK